MKKYILTVLMILMLVVASGCSGGEAYRDPDKYDVENYIGAADVPSYLVDEVGITREEMSNFTIDGDKAIMSGVISEDTIRQVKKLIAEYPAVKTIVMKNVEGSVDDVSNLEASRLIRTAGIDTYVPSGGFIASGGTDFFCAGVKRTVEEGAKVGVHSWADDKVNNAALLSKDSEEHKKYIAYYEEMKMPNPEGFYFFTIEAAVADDMYYMTMDELATYGLISE